jgi:hypothetical protein
VILGILIIDINEIGELLLSSDSRVMILVML